MKSRAGASIGFGVPVPEFIPYACHYDPHTLMTKNGELVQVIKLTGFANEKVGVHRVDIRQAIRQALHKNVTDNRFVIRFHTIRKRKDLRLESGFDDVVSHEINDAWNEVHHWQDQFTNEVYISIVHESQLTNIKSWSAFFRSLSSKREFKFRQDYFEESFQRLNKAAEGIANDLSTFGVSRLGVIKYHGEYYSELVSFVGKIIFLADVLMPMPTMDISEYMATHKIAFGFNAIEVASQSGKRHFGAMFSIKNYNELPTSALDKILQLPSELIISQSGVFMSPELAKKGYEQRSKIFEISGETELDNILELTETAGKNGPTDFVRQYISVLIIGNTLQHLETEVMELIKVFSTIGVVVARRDVFLQQGFWSQLPGNFGYISHTSPLPTSQIGGFASLYNFPAGNEKDNHWGEAVTLFRTAAGTPYFFNFHVGDVGHTSIIGPMGMGKTVLMNFLVAQSMKFKPRVLYLDIAKRSEVFIPSMGGNYHTLSTKGQIFELNPFALINTNENRDFLIAFIGNMLTLGYSNIDPEKKAVIQGLVADIFQLPEEKRYLSYIHRELALKYPILDELHDWFGEGKYASLFDHQNDRFLADLPILAFCIDDLLSSPDTLLPFMTYFVFRINTLVRDNQRTIIVISDAWKLLDNALLGPIVERWMDYLKTHNAMLIIASESPEEVTKSKITAGIVNKLATEIFLPNPVAKDVYKTIFGLKDHEFSQLLELSIPKRQVMLKQNDDAVVIELNMKQLPQISLLSGNHSKTEIMHQCIAETSENPADWVALYLSRATE